MEGLAQGGLVISGTCEVNRGANLVTINPQQVREAVGGRVWPKEAIGPVKIPVSDAVLLDAFEAGETYTYTIHKVNQ